MVLPTAYRVVLLSAGSEAALRDAATALAAELRHDTAAGFRARCADLARRPTLSHRLALVADGGAAASAQIARFLDGDASAPHEEDVWGDGGTVVSGVPPVADAPLTLLMSDVGTDWWGAGSWLLPEGAEGPLLLGGDREPLAAAARELALHGWPDPTPLLLRPAEDFARGANATPAETHSGILGLHVAMLAVWRGECSNGRLGLWPLPRV